MKPFKIICDETNNTEEDKANNIMKVDLSIMLEWPPSTPEYANYLIQQRKAIANSFGIPESVLFGRDEIKSCDEAFIEFFKSRYLKG